MIRILGDARAFARAALVAIGIALIPQGVWSALIIANLKVSPRVPWAVAVMLVLLLLMWRYLGGGFAQKGTVNSRQRHMRFARVAPRVNAWALVAGGLSLLSLTGLWIVLARLVRMPGSVLPSMANVPAPIATLAIVTGAAISPICEQIGIWGYGQTMLRSNFTRMSGIVLSALIFAVLPHPPFGVTPLLKAAFFFLVGLVFAVTADLTGSIKPNFPVHVLGLLIFFTIIWPNDPQRVIVSVRAVDPWFIIHSVQVLVFGLLAIYAFTRLDRVVTAAEQGSGMN